MSDPNVPPPPGGDQPPPPPGQPPQPPQPPMPPQPPVGQPPVPPQPPMPPQPPAAPPGGYAPPPAQPPGGYAPQPAQPYGGGGAEMPQLEVGAAISYGWKKFTENVGPFIILVLAVFVAVILLNILQAVLTPNNGGFLALVWSLALSIVVMVVSFIIQAGVYRAGLGVTRGQQPSVSMLTQTDNMGPYILTVILVGLGAFVGFLLCIIPGIIWLIFTAYAPILALDKGMSPVEAITTSLNWVKDNMGQVFLILLVSWVVYIAGALLCGVGLLVSIPVALVAIIYSYRALTNEPVVP